MAIDLTKTQLEIAELYKIELEMYSASAYFTSYKTSFSFGGQSYQAIPIKRGDIQFHSDFSTDKLDIQAGIIGIQVGTLTLSMYRVVREGYLRNAKVTVYLVEAANPANYQTVFIGWINGDVTYNQGILTLSCGSLLERLKDKFPRLIYSEHCNHSLFDDYCGLNKATYQENGTCLINSTERYIYSTIFSTTSHPLKYWKNGEVLMTSGLNTGMYRTILFHANGFVTLSVPFYQTIGIGDTFVAIPGCNKTGAQCDEKFSNYANFLGFEYIPKPDVMWGLT